MPREALAVQPEGFLEAAAAVAEGPVSGACPLPAPPPLSPGPGVWVTAGCYCGGRGCGAEACGVLLRPEQCFISCKHSSQDQTEQLPWGKFSGVRMSLLLHRGPAHRPALASFPRSVPVS